MTPEWNGIERRLERLKGCLLKLEPLKTKTTDKLAPIPTSTKNEGVTRFICKQEDELTNCSKRLHKTVQS